MSQFDPHRLVAQWDTTRGTVTVWSSTQVPHYIHKQHMDLKIGVRNDGTITAVDFSSVLDGGVPGVKYLCAMHTTDCR